MSVRRKRTVALFNSVLRVAFLLGIFVVLNFFISPHHFSRADLTDDRIYTITNATKNLLSKLEDNLILRGYFSEDLPRHLQQLPSLVRDILAEYEAYGNGKVEVQFVDPNKDAQAREFAEGLGIKPIPIQDREGDKIVVRNCYLSLAAFYLDKNEKVEGIGDVNTLEYELTRAIVKITEQEIPRVGLLIDSAAGSAKGAARNEQVDRANTFDTMFNTLQTQYRVQKVYLKSGQPVPEGINTLLVIRPRDLTEREVFEIDQFIMRGGKIAFFLDTVQFDAVQKLAATEIDSGLDDLLKHYGVEVGKGLVLDETAEYVSMIHRQGPFAVQQRLLYPYWVKMSKDELDQTNPVVKKLGSLVLYWASPLTIDRTVTGDREIVELVRTTDKAWFAENYDNIYPQTSGLNWGYYRRPDESNRKSYLLAAVQIGEFDSFYAGKEIPEVERPESSRPAADLGPGANLPPELRDRLPKNMGLPQPPVPTPKGADNTATPLKEEAKKSDGSTPDLPPPHPALSEDPAPLWQPPTEQESTPDQGESKKNGDSKEEGDSKQEGGSKQEGDPQNEPFEIPKKPERKILTRSPETRVMVVADADIVTDSHFAEPRCFTFIQNTVDWMALGNELIEIRSRGVTDRTIDVVEESKALWIKALLCVGLPLFVLIIGLIRFLVRSS